ncbi:MAG: TlpA family protein disulfide reductase [Nitrospinae bacterium]|nr:TlpA family protein disulfide reductase [Nitrospinota bacterium]
MPTRLNWTLLDPPAVPRILLWIAVLTLWTAAPVLAGEDPPVSAPAFTLQTLDGHEVALDDFQGNYLLINFWATWCLPCKVEMPSLELLYQKFKERNLKVIAISNDIFGAQVVEPYIQAQNFTFMVGLDPKLKISNQFGVISLPTTFLIDPQGQIIGVLNGAENWSDPKTLLYFDQLLQTPITATENLLPAPCQETQKVSC